MSLHYEWLLSLRLRPDTPEALVEELRYHLGLSDQAPDAPTLDVPGQALAVGEGVDELPGGPLTTLVRQQYGPGLECWSMFARIFVVDDAMYELVQVVPQWLAGWSLTQGWVGMAREELGLNPWLHFYIAGGHAYASAPDEEPQPLNEDAPPFELTQTTSPWPLAD